MQVLNSTFGYQFFLHQLRQAKQRILLLDYDGTIAPFLIQRDQAIPYPGIRELLIDLLRDKKTRIVIISGRAIADLKPLLAIEPLPEMWGSHGWERSMANGNYFLEPLPREAKEGLLEAQKWIRRVGLMECCEFKPVSLAIHWRGLSDAEGAQIANKVMRKWRSLAQKAGLMVKPFDKGIELRVPGRDKGTVVQEIIQQADDDSIIAYLGDDTTDEDAFKALGNRGLSILVRPESRKTAAHLWLTPPEDLLDFLNQWKL